MFFDNVLKEINKSEHIRCTLEESIEELDDKIEQARRELESIKKANEIINIVAKQTQSQLEYKISELITLALASVFDDPYEFSLEFVQRRNKTEADLLFRRGEDYIKPIEASGGGALDIASWALRLACWNINSPKTRPVLILDEPFKFLSKDKHEVASSIVKKLGEKLDIQIIMNTHSPVIKEKALSYTHVVIKNRISAVENGVNIVNENLQQYE